MFVSALPDPTCNSEESANGGNKQILLLLSLLLLLPKFQWNDSSHTKTKMELTIYLGQKIKEYADRCGKQLVVAWGSVCKATHKDVGNLQSNQ